MKLIIRQIFLSLLISMALMPATASVTDADDNGPEDYKYEEKYLSGRRDGFIQQHGNMVIKDFRISGISKTRPLTILKEIHTQPGENLSSFDCYHTVNSLKKKNIFSSIELNYIRENEGVIVEIIVREKWTLIPIPLFTSNGNRLSAGLYVMESNFMGYGKMIFAGGSYSTAGNSALIGFVDPSLNSTDLRFNLFLSYKKFIYETGDMKENTFNEYRAENMLCRADLGYSFPYSINLFLSGGYRQNIIDKEYNRGYNLPDSVKVYPAGLLLNVDRIYHYEYLFYGFKLDSGWYYCFNDGTGADYSYGQYNAQYSFKLFTYHRLAIHSSGSYGNRPEIMGERISGRTGTMTLPPDIISADRWINGTAIYEYPLFRFSRGAVTIQAFWEQGLFGSDEVDTTRYYGPGCGTLLYLKNISLPAMGFNVGHNVKTDNTEFSFYVGMSM